MSLIARALVGAACLLSQTVSADQNAMLTEEPASSYRLLVDPEFSAANSMVAWVDVDGSIWVADVDRATGNFVPANGKGVLIDRRSTNLNEMRLTLNGPEWAFRQGGDAIVYTRFLAGQTPSPATARVVMAVPNADGTWTKAALTPSSARVAPYASESAADTAPRVTYTDEFGIWHWRELLRPETEEVLPLKTPGPFPVVRHVRGQRAVAYTVTVDGIDQVFRYDLDAHVLEQLTSDGGSKADPRMWRAPEFGGEVVLMANVGSKVQRLYRQLPDGDGQLRWTQFHSVVAPQGGMMSSSEPFEYGGKSYFVMQVSIGAYPSSIWLANIDPAAPLLRRLTPESPERARSDPEVFVSDAGPVVYYNRWDPTKGSSWVCLKCAEGLFRVGSGLSIAP